MVVFLDVGGVLSPSSLVPGAEDTMTPTGSAVSLSRSCTKRFVELIESIGNHREMIEHDLVVVISSEWRLDRHSNFPALLDALQETGMSLRRVVGCTRSLFGPDLGSLCERRPTGLSPAHERIREILDWLSNDELGRTVGNKWVAIDDLPLAAAYRNHANNIGTVEDHFVRTDAASGLTEDTVEQLRIKLLKQGRRPRNETIWCLHDDCMTTSEESFSDEEALAQHWREVHSKKQAEEEIGASEARGNDTLAYLSKDAVAAAYPVLEHQARRRCREHRRRKLACKVIDDEKPMNVSACSSSSISNSLGSSSELSMLEQNVVACVGSVLNDRTCFTANASIGNAPRCCIFEPNSFFAAWNGVLCVVFDGFPHAVVELKSRLDQDCASFLPKENFGSKWPKTSLGALTDDAPPFTRGELEKLRAICRCHSEDLLSSRSEAAEFATARSKKDGECKEESREVCVEVGSLSVVEYSSRSLEIAARRRVAHVPFGHAPATSCILEETNQGSPPAGEVARVQSVLSEWDDIEGYLPKFNMPGSRISSYREASPSGATLVAFLFPDLLCRPVCAGMPPLLKAISIFRDAVDQEFPGRWVWLADESLHCTIRSLRT